jgi:hypothetical protein
VGSKIDACGWGLLTTTKDLLMFIALPLLGRDINSLAAGIPEKTNHESERKEPLRGGGTALRGMRRLATPPVANSRRGASQGLPPTRA